MEGIFGTERYFRVEYSDVSVENISVEQGSERDCLTYTIYESRYSWLLKKIWNDETDKVRMYAEDAAEAWQADSALCQYYEDGGYRAFVLYKNRMLIFHADTASDEKQIETIRDRLDGAVYYD